MLTFLITISSNQYCYSYQDEDLAMIAAQQYYAEYGRPATN